MFSPSKAEGGPATATRSRRRQRPKSSENLVPQPKAKRQRVPLTEQTFVNPDAQPEMMEVKADKPAMLEPASDNVENVVHTPRREVHVRAKKTKHGDRAANKGDGSLLLTSTSAYTVSKLPALPDRIRTDWSGKQHADIFPSSGYALTMTATHAIVWPYSSTSPSPETFTFTLPSASKPSDPLPVGTLVSPSASAAEPGLVVVMAGSGKVVYWESISSAATFAFMKRERAGVEYVISSMSVGEKVTAITNAESAGFVLTFNTGRLAYMNLRDGHGRPSISVQFLRTSLVSSAGGIFGSIRHAFSNLSLRGDIAAVRADRSARVGEKNVVALTVKGRFQAWRISRGGHHETIGEADLRDELISAIQEADPVSRSFSVESFETHDFTFVPKGLETKYLELSRLSDAMASEDPMTQHLLLLVSFTKKSESRYAMVEVILTPEQAHVGMIRPITSYNTPFVPSNSLDTVRPQIYLPRPALVAFLVFHRASVIASIATPPESPDSQLQSDNNILPASFEDVVDFRGDNVHEILGSGCEDTSSHSEEGRSSRHKNKNPAVILCVRGAGIVKIITTDVDKFASDQPPQVSAKSKLEQAVFFGAKQDNPLIFDRRQQKSFPEDEISKAALDVSQEILSSSTSYISTLPVSMEDNLLARSESLARLMKYLRATDAELDRATRWNLLFNAEKMHVALKLWKLQEGFIASRAAEDKKSMIGEIVEFIHEDQKHNPVAKIGEVDRVRHWFVNDIFRLELFIAWAYEVIKVLYKDNLLDETKMTKMIYEAIQINIKAHSAALEFRKNNLSLYGLSKEELRMGILCDGYSGLPEPWTGCHYVANNLKRLLELTSQWCDRLDGGGDKPQKSASSETSLIAKAKDDLPALTDAMLTSILEFARWGMSTVDQKALAQNFAKVYQEDRYEKTISLARSGKWEDGVKIAENHGCLPAVAVILLDHIEHLESRLALDGLSLMEQQKIKNLRESKKTQLEECFSSYGKEFAFPMYDYLLTKHGVDAVLEFSLDKSKYKTEYLRSRPELARISWINDVQQEGDLDHAADTLLTLAFGKEQQVWSRKVELSLGKLALMAKAESSPSSTRFKITADEVYHEGQLKKIDDELTSITIQSQLYDLISPITYDAVDEAAALNLAIEAYGSAIPKRQKACHQIFEEGMKRLLRHEALDAMTLIDMLTLASWNIEASAGFPDPFWLALKVAESSCHPDDIRDAKKLLWRRLYIRDEWAKINDTSLKDDQQVVVRLAQTELFKALCECVRQQDNNHPFQPQPPAEVLGAFTESVDRRFHDFDAGFQSKLIDAMKWEDKILLGHIEKHRLAKWIPETFKAAQTEVEDILDEATNARMSARDLA